MRPVVILDGAAYALVQGALCGAPMHAAGAHFARFTPPPADASSQLFPDEWVEIHPLDAHHRAIQGALQVLEVIHPCQASTGVPR